MTGKAITIHDEVLRLARSYFGPECARHLSRLIGAHLGKAPQDMTKDDLVSLIDWIKSAILCIDEDATAVEKYIEELLALEPSS